MSFKMEVLESMLDRSNYDPVIWEDVLEVQKELETQIELLQEEQEKLLNDFCDLIQIIVDEHLVPERLKDAIKEKFINSKTIKP